jgi:Arc/MetJ-type ribon-helix-helix transcriptional regulator
MRNPRSSRSGSTAGSIVGVKLSVSLSAEDVAFVDEYGERTGEPSRSSVIQRAIGLLRAAELEEEYASAFDEWAAAEAGETARAWDRTAADGLADEAR